MLLKSQALNLCPTYCTCISAVPVLMFFLSMQSSHPLLMDAHTLLQADCVSSLQLFANRTADTSHKIQRPPLLIIQVVSQVHIRLLRARGNRHQLQGAAAAAANLNALHC